jgi:hypothetical protein
MPEQSVMVWIEDGTGRITRGQADSVSGEGACVRLAEKPDWGEGDEVAVRISFERGTPTVGATARVGAIRPGAGEVLCDLRWNAPADQRSALDEWLAHAA